MDNSHNSKVIGQFDPKAAAYLTSAVHASGADLDRMVALVGSQPEAIALDMGTGGGHAAFRLASNVGKVVAYDLSPSMLRVVADEALRRGLDNIEVREGAAEQLPFADRMFDIVVTRFSAHHWQDIKAGIREMRRVLKPGGMAIFIDVVTPGEPLLDTWLQSLELLRDPSHVRNASLQEWQAMLQAAGFEIGISTPYRLRLQFAAWVERMQTPKVHIEAIRSLQQRAGDEVAGHFAFEKDGSFTVDTLLISAA